MIEFEFTVVPTIGDEIHEFDLGDIIIRTEKTEISSKIEGVGPSMMIFLSLSDFLHGIKKIVESNKKEVFYFNGIDSSFSLTIESVINKKIRICNKLKGEMLVNECELLHNLTLSASNFYKKNIDMIGSGAAKNDLHCAIQEFRKIRGLGK